MRSRREEVLWKLLDGSPWEWGYFLLGVFTVVLILWLFVRVMRWVRDDDDPAEIHETMLTEFREIRRQGDLSEEEYRNIKGRLIEDHPLYGEVQKQTESAAETNSAPKETESSQEDND